MNEEYPTFDIYLSAYLSLHKFDYKLKQKDGKVAFVFKLNSALNKAIQRYHNGDKMRLNTFVQRVKDLKVRMYSMKNG